MNLYKYFKEQNKYDNFKDNPFAISENEELGLASIKYNLVSSHFSWDIPYALDARGLVVEMETGKVVARPYRKFFNYLENEYAKWVDLPYCVEEKVDGSLVILSTYKGELLVASSGSVREDSDHVQLFKAYLDTHLSKEQRKELVDFCNDYTLCLEYVSPNNQIVVEYDTEDMILHGVINTKTAEDVTTQYSYTLAKKLGFTQPKLYDTQSVEDVLDTLKQLENAEGFVVKFENGYMLKFKTEDYVKKHALVSNFNMNPKSKSSRTFLLNSLFGEDIDDVYPMLSNASKEYLEEMKNNKIEFSTEYLTFKEQFGDLSPDVRKELGKRLNTLKGTENAEKEKALISAVLKGMGEVDAAYMYLSKYYDTTKGG